MRRTDRLRRLNQWREMKRSQQQRAFYTHRRLDFILKPTRSHLGLLNEEAMKVFQNVTEFIGATLWEMEWRLQK